MECKLFQAKLAFNKSSETLICHLEQSHQLKLGHCPELTIHEHLCHQKSKFDDWCAFVEVEVFQNRIVFVQAEYRKANTGWLICLPVWRVLKKSNIWIFIDCICVWDALPYFKLISSNMSPDTYFTWVSYYYCTTCLNVMNVSLVSWDASFSLQTSIKTEHLVCSCFWLVEVLHTV